MSKEEPTLNIIRYLDGWRADLRYTDANGKRARKRIALASKKRRTAKREAQEKAREFLAGVDGPTAPTAPFSGFAKLWLDRRSNHYKPATIRNYRSHIKTHLFPRWGDVDLRDIDRASLMDFQASLATTHAPRSVNQITTLLLQMLRSAHQWGYRGPVPDIEQLKIPRNEYRWWNAEQSAKVLAFLARKGESGDPDAIETHTATFIGLRTGLRIGEIIALRWTDIALDAQTPHITVRLTADTNRLGYAEGPPKSGRFRVVPLSPEVTRFLHNLDPLEQMGRVIKTKSSPRAFAAKMRRRLTEAAKRVAVPRLTPHGLRHSYCSQLASAGVAIQHIQQWAGHTEIAMTMKYAHLAPLDGASLVAVLDTQSGAPKTNPKEGPDLGVLDLEMVQKWSKSWEGASTDPSDGGP